MLQRHQTSEVGIGSVRSSSSDGDQSDPHVILQGLDVGGEEKKADQLVLLDAPDAFIRNGQLQENSIRYPALDLKEEELYFRDTEQPFAFGQCEPMTSYLIGCMPSMPQTRMKRHLFATDFVQRNAFEVILDNLKNYKRMYTGLQFLGVSPTQIDTTLIEFATNLIIVVFGREHTNIIGNLWNVIRTGSRSDLSTSKEFAICVAECVVWVFAHVHNRWCVKDPNSFESTTEVPVFGGPRFVFAIRHFGDTAVENNSWREPVAQYLNRHFLDMGGSRATLLQRLSMCELVYFVLLCVKLVHNDVLFTHTLESWGTEARNISQRNIGRSFGIIFGARGFTKGNVDREYLSAVYDGYATWVSTVAEQQADSERKQKRRKTEMAHNHLRFVGVRYISSTPTIAHFTPRFTNKNKKGRDDCDAARRSEIPKILSHFFFHPLYRPIRDSDNATWFRVQVQWLLPQDVSRAISQAHAEGPDIPDTSDLEFLQHPETHIDLRAFRNSYLFIHNNLWRPVPPSELAHFQAPILNYQESLLLEYRLRWFDPHQWLWVLLGQSDQLDLTRLEWAQMEVHPITPQHQELAEAYYTSFVGDNSSAGAAWAVHPENLRRFYHQAWKLLPGGTPVALYQTLERIETQYLEELCAMFMNLHSRTNVGHSIFSLMQEHLSLSTSATETQLSDTARAHLSTPETFEALWAATNLTPTNSSMLPENWKTTARSVIMSPDISLSPLGPPQSLSVNTWNNPNQPLEIVSSDQLTVWWQQEMNTSQRVLDLFIRDVLFNAACITVGPERKSWRQFARETNTQHAAHTIVAHVMQQLEQFIDQLDIISKLELSLRLGTHTRVSPDLLDRMAHLIQIVPEAKLKESAFSRLASIIELCIDNSSTVDAPPVQFVPLMEAQPFSDAEEEEEDGSQTNAHRDSSVDAQRILSASR